MPCRTRAGGRRVKLTRGATNGIQYLVKLDGQIATFECKNGGHKMVQDFSKGQRQISAEALAKFAPYWGLGLQKNGTRGHCYGWCQRCQNETDAQLVNGSDQELGRTSTWEFVSVGRDGQRRSVVTITVQGRTSPMLSDIITRLIVGLSGRPRLGKFVLKRGNSASSSRRSSGRRARSSSSSRSGQGSRASSGSGSTTSARRRASGRRARSCSSCTRSVSSATVDAGRYATTRCTKIRRDRRRADCRQRNALMCSSAGGSARSVTRT